MLNRLRQQGFTILELMIAVTVLSVLLLFGAPSFSTWLQNSQIRTASEAIQNGIHLARAEAVRRNTLVRFQLTDNLDAGCATSTSGGNWVVSVDAIGGNCNALPSDTTAPRIVQKRASGDGSRNAVVAAGQSSIVFNGLGRVMPVPAGNISIDISNPSGGNCAAASGPMRCLRVVVSTAGQVRLCDPQFTSPDPQGC